MAEAIFAGKGKLSPFLRKQKDKDRGRDTPRTRFFPQAASLDEINLKCKLTINKLSNVGSISLLLSGVVHKQNKPQ